MIDEHELLQAWGNHGDKRNSQLAFNRLYAKYNKKVLRDARRLSSSAEDTAQAVWMSLSKALADKRIPDYASLEEYLYRLTQMESRYSREKDSKWQWAKTALGPLPDTPDASVPVETGQIGEHFDRAIDRMPPAVQAAWRYKRLGHDERYACRQLKIPGRTYRRRIAEARAVLKATLQELN
jgi:DNA-directed RNA polymerase specialized sigma24 family protein